MLFTQAKDQLWSMVFLVDSYQITFKINVKVSLAAPMSDNKKGIDWTFRKLFIAQFIV